MPLDLLLLGPPGAGKGTQAKRIASDRGIRQIATGDMLREAMAAGSELGRQVRPIYDRGDLVPDDLIVALIRERLGNDDTHAGFVLDGFPRTLPQAEALDEMLAAIGRELSVVLEFQIDEEEAVRRLVGRAGEEHRADDDPDVVRHRFAVYRERTAPLSRYYLARGILVGIPAGGTVPEVSAEVQSVLDQVEAR